MSQPGDPNGTRNVPHATKYKPFKQTMESGKKYRDKDRRGGYATGGYSSKPRPPFHDASLINPPNITLLKTRREARSPSPTTSSETKDQGSDPAAPPALVRGEPRGPKAMRAPVKFLSEELTFVESLSDYLGENPDFLVVGCVGLQWSGKSSLLSHLAASDCSGTSTARNIFRLSDASQQIVGESSTKGLDAFVSSERVIWLDCQPLLSAAAAERELAAAHTKDAYKESLAKPSEVCVGTTVEVQSLQTLSFLYCVCHVLLVVQDSLADPNLVRLLQTAEMLKPSLGGTVVDGDSSSGEHTPHLITVYNRSQPADLAPAVMDQTLRFYRQAFAKSRLQISSRLLADPDLAAHVLHHQDVNFVPLLDWNLNDADAGVCTPYERMIPIFKRALLALPRHTFPSTASTEKTWFSYAGRAWDSVRKSGLMMEYARLLQ